MLRKNKNIILILFILISAFLPIQAFAGCSVFDFYQKVISPVDGDRCPMYPSCSHYAVEAVNKHGFFIGWIMMCDRLVRCGRNETSVSRPVEINGQTYVNDPLEANDFWWFHAEKEK